MNPDTTPTPRTDAESRDGYTYFDMGGRSSLQSCDYEKSKYGEIVIIDFARQLERELSEKTNEAARLRELCEELISCLDLPLSALQYTEKLNQLTK